MTLGARLRAARERAGLTLAQVAERSGAHLQAVYRIEAGKMDPTASRLAALCRALGVSADAMLGLRPRRRATPR